MILFVWVSSVYNFSMIYTPKNITELKTIVRAYMVDNPDKRAEMREIANINENPGLFDWLRLWVAIQKDNGITKYMLDGLFYGEY